MWRNLVHPHWPGAGHVLEPPHQVGNARIANGLAGFRPAAEEAGQPLAHHVRQAHASRHGKARRPERPDGIDCHLRLREAEADRFITEQVAASAELWAKSVELERFSEREKEILRLLRDNMRREDIADKLSISFFTVRRHIQNMLEKTGEPTVKAILEKFGKVLGA